MMGMATDDPVVRVGVGVRLGVGVGVGVGVGPEVEQQKTTHRKHEKKTHETAG